MAEAKARIWPDLAYLFRLARHRIRYEPVIGAIGALMNRVLQPRPLVVLGLTVWMGTAAGADELALRLATCVRNEERGTDGRGAATAERICHRRPYVGASRPRYWSHLPVLGAISWAFIA